MRATDGNITVAGKSVPAVAGIKRPANWRFVVIHERCVQVRFAGLMVIRDRHSSLHASQCRRTSAPSISSWTYYRHLCARSLAPTLHLNNHSQLLHKKSPKLCQYLVKEMPHPLHQKYVLPCCVFLNASTAFPSQTSAVIVPACRETSH